MTKQYDIIRWQKGMWVLCDASRSHHEVRNQIVFSPYFYPFLDKYPRRKRVMISLSDEKLSPCDYRLRGEKINDKFFSYTDTSAEQDILIPQDELMDLFGYSPDEIYITIEEGEIG